MATLILGAAASALIGATGAAGLIATAITTAATIGGSILDSYLFGARGVKGQHSEGQRLQSLQVLSSAEGAAIPIIAGHARVSGQVIWATNLIERVTTTTQKHGGKGGRKSATSTATEYTYFANFAVGICEGPISGVLRVWADGKELDLTTINHRIYKGSETQQPDELIEAKQGTGNAPAYRGTAYIVFEELPLAKYGNRIPQLTFEIVRAVGYEEEILTGLCLIPGATEFGYSPDLVQDHTGGVSKADNNRHTKVKGSDWRHSLDLMQAVCPNVKTVMLVVAWFGNDLRCGSCQIKPCVEFRNKETSPISWQVAGVTRDVATVVSTVNGKPAFGGSPNDASVIAAIRDLKARGLRVFLYPFIMMDVPKDNGLPDPYGRGEQPVYPWRGRITCHPAPGEPGTVDKTAAAATQAAFFLGTASAAHFGGSGTTVTYSGPSEWSYRRFILHLAKVAHLAGGVDAFAIGTEMPGMTSIRSSANQFPFVDGLVALLGEVRAIVGSGTKLTYAADWSEYHSYRPADGSGDVLFNLDPLWSHAQLDFIGIDNYLPLSDWRDEAGHLDHSPRFQSIHDLDYLQSNIEGGEYYHWYYASDADRANQNRTPIYDGAHGEDWVYRQKDIRGWWQSPHHNRPGGVRQSGATSWTPEGKPIWFTEFGCPAIDKGTNQPNVFHDPKSSESFVPHFSSGARDDLIQRRYLRALISYWQDANQNPVSSVYGGRMIDTGNLFAWAWDVRPFPSFPVHADAWADHANFYTGHWLSGRLGGAPADGIARLMMERSGLVEGVDFETGGFDGVADGFIIDNVTSARSVVETLGASFFFDPMESGGRIVGRSRRFRFPVLSLKAEGLLDRGRGNEPVTIRRAQQTELPRVVRLTCYDVSRDFESVTGEGILEEVTNDRVVVTDTPIIADYDRVQATAESLLQEQWAGREAYTLGLPESALALESGDVLSLDFGGRSHTLRVVKAQDGNGRHIEAKSYDGLVYEPARSLGRVYGIGGQKEQAAALGVFIDGPLLRDSDNGFQGYVTGFKLPFAPGLVFLSSASESGFQARAGLAASGVIGETKTDLLPGPLYRWDNTNSVDVELYGGELASLTDEQVLAGGNAALIQSASGDWELLQYGRADLIAKRTYRLSRLLRGQRGSEQAMGAASGARVVILDGSIEQSGLDRALIGLPLHWQVGPADGAVGDDDFASYGEITFSGRGERPLSPVHLKAEALAGGDVALSWIRRTRIGGDGWEQAEVPLGEDLESYEIEIWKDGTLKRVLTSAAQTVTYSASDQVVDLGIAGETSFTFFVFQISATYGRGASAQEDYQP
ncbi:baseplate multidomain protein megatron [Roseibium sediminis]|uniref:baseplate multidomain protein megatron n=1 Tax=Roseibium sediminis TaxID=1775174 RepID=UPI00123DA154|nr:glycoside hydrolase/phage tail family protein [Roseibium sediminis]